jgi:hypothetical protein
MAVDFPGRIRMRSTRLSKLFAFAVVMILGSSQLPAWASDAGSLAATPRMSFNNWESAHRRTEMDLDTSRQYAMRDLLSRQQHPGDGSLAPHAAAMFRIGAR